MNAPQIRYPRLRTLLRIALLVLLLLAAAIGLGNAFKYTHWSGFVPVQAPLHGGKSTPTVGLLGGVAIHIPPYVADYPEFDGDPTWVHWPLHKQSGAASTSIRRFGFLLQHPNMQVVNDHGLRSQARKALELEADHPWLLAQVVSNEQFPGPEALRRFVRERVPDEADWPALPPPGHTGLVQLKPSPVAPHGEATTAHGGSPDDRHLAYDTEGQLLAYVACSNDPVLPRYCLQVWSLEGRGWPVLVSVSYRRTLQADWALIQRGATEALLAMRVSP